MPQLLQSHTTTLGEGMTIRRALPNRSRRMVGAWCFLDHLGPVATTGDGLRVGPHPHIGLQTFSWQIEGEVFHRDSLGSEQLIRPGQVNLMTAGRGIAHSEETPAEHGTTLHAAQLWIALPEAERRREPAFHHYPNLPVFDQDRWQISVLAGEFNGHSSPALVYSPLVGLELLAADAANTTLPLRADFEYGAMLLSGSATLAGQALEVGELLYFEPGATALEISTHAPARLLLLGGQPFSEEVLLWWNFVARTPAEIRQATTDWNAGNGFGEVHGYPGERLLAPEVPKLRGE
ncbi:pirin family protein [Andreprevotia chitinilytica]|uniref:pirin family protein n=1 Tax=Andreprevotia chitinilytica TaxID=396808 RepID=UPI0005592099|nr:pirin family protein [Andreprevotia chitinilytica]